MAYANYEVVVNFNDSVNNFDLPYVQSISDPQPQAKDTIIKGVRGDGSIRIKGGKRSHEIRIRGKLYDPDGYADLTTLIAEMRTKVTTDTATLTLKHRPIAGGGWTTDWVYTVIRISEITFSDSRRIGTQEYSISFLVLVY